MCLARHAAAVVGGGVSVIRSCCDRSAGRGCGGHPGGADAAGVWWRGRARPRQCSASAAPAAAGSRGWPGMGRRVRCGRPGSASAAAAAASAAHVAAAWRATPGGARGSGAPTRTRPRRRSGSQSDWRTIVPAVLRRQRSGSCPARASRRCWLRRRPEEAGGPHAVAAKALRHWGFRAASFRTASACAALSASGSSSCVAASSWALRARGPAARQARHTMRVWGRPGGCTADRAAESRRGRA